MGRIRVLLASNFVLFRTGLRALLTGCPNIEVSGESAVNSETLSRIQELQPDVLILEAAPENPEAISTVFVLRRELPAIKIIAVANRHSRDFALRLLREGVRGYISNREALSELVTAVEAVAHDQVFLCPSGSDALLSGFREQERERERLASPNGC